MIKSIYETLKSNVDSKLGNHIDPSDVEASNKAVKEFYKNLDSEDRKLVNQVFELSFGLSLEFLIRINDQQNNPEIKDGKEHYFWVTNPNNEKALSIGTLYHCDKCKSIASVNSVWVTGFSNSAHEAIAIAQANRLGVIDNELFCDDDGDDCCTHCS